MFTNEDEFYRRALCRTEALIGAEAMRRLRASSVLVCGLGGVGSYAAMALARSGVGRLSLCDGDVVTVSNLNRQLIADTETIGMKKTDATAAAIRRINPFTELNLIPRMIGPDDIEEITRGADAVCDAIDTISAKLALVEYCKRNNIEIVSSMGTGRKLRPELLETADIYETSVCPLAKIMRKELRKRGVRSLRVVYSKEEPVTAETGAASDADSLLAPKRLTLSSSAFVPPAAGMIIAAEIVRYLGQV